MSASVIFCVTLHNLILITMKNTITAAVAFIVLASCNITAFAQKARNNAASQPKELKTVTTDKPEYDYGRIMEKDGKVSRTITVINKGGTPVAISDVRTFCGCAAPSFTHAVLRPGQNGKVTITYDPTNRSGKFSKDIYIILNDGRNYIQTKIKGEVVPYLHPVTEEYPYAFGRGLYMGLKVLPFANQGTGIRQKVQLRIANDTREKMVITFTRKPDNRVLHMPERIELKPLERTTITASYAYPKDYTYDRHLWLEIKVNGKPVNPMKVVFYGTHNVLHMY